MKFRTILACLVIAGFVSLLSAPAVVGQKKKGDPNITYRQKVMKSLGANMGGIGDILKNKLPLTENLAGHARNINNGAKMILSAFKNEVVKGKTRAKPDIWSKGEDFRKAANALVKESGKLARVASSMDKAAFGAQLKATGKTCGGCHKKFRKKKKKM